MSIRPRFKIVEIGNPIPIKENILYGRSRGYMAVCRSENRGKNLIAVAQSHVFHGSTWQRPASKPDPDRRSDPRFNSNGGRAYFSTKA